MYLPNKSAVSMHGRVGVWCRRELGHFGFLGKKPVVNGMWDREKILESSDNPIVTSQNQVTMLWSVFNKKVVMSLVGSRPVVPTAWRDPLGGHDSTALMLSGLC